MAEERGIAGGKVGRGGPSGTRVGRFGKGGGTDPKNPIAIDTPDAVDLPNASQKNTERRGSRRAPILIKETTGYPTDAETQTGKSGPEPGAKPVLELGVGRGRNIPGALTSTSPTSGRSAHTHQRLVRR